MKRYQKFVGAVAFTLVAAGCSSMSSSGMPEGLFGTWEGGNNAVNTVSFSEGGRIEINGECHGTYTVDAIDGNVGDITSGYIQCPPVMDGYIKQVEATLDGSTLTLSGPVINGTYERK